MVHGRAVLDCVLLEGSALLRRAALLAVSVKLLPVFMPSIVSIKA